MSVLQPGVHSATNNDAQVIGGLFANIPPELQERRQWCVWRSEWRHPASKPTKVPYQPNGHKADVTKPETWSSFSDVCSAPLSCSQPVDPNAPIAATGFSGVGYVFSASDPYCGIDLDDTKGDAAAAAFQQQLYAKANSYSELSPSGNGVHIITKATLPHGRRRGSIEIYSANRFFTMTGNVINKVSIADGQELAERLFAELGGQKSDAEESPQSELETQTDEAVLAAMFSAGNGEKARQLYAGNWQAYYGSNSEADLSLINIIAFHTRNAEQAARLFRASTLGQRQKAQRKNYVEPMVSKALTPRFAILDHSKFTCNGQPLPWIAEQPTTELPTLIDAADLLTSLATPRLDVWGGNVPLGQTTLLFSAGGVGKSLLLQQLATSVALGLPYLGIQCMEGVALYVTCEDPADEIKRRQHDDCRERGLSFADKRQRLGLVSLTNVIGNELAAFDQSGRMTVMPRFHWLLETIKAIGAKLVILDNVAHFFAGNENVRNQVAAFLGLLNKLAYETGAAIILIAHTNKAGDGSGSTAWLNQVRTALKLEIPADANGFVADFNARVLTRIKSNYSRTGESIAFRWHKGAFKLEGELATGEAEAVKADARALSDNRHFLVCLAERTRQRRAVSELVSKSYAPSVFARMAESQGIGKARLEAAMDRLFKVGAIERGFLWRDTAEGKDRYGLRERPANGSAILPPTGSANDRQPEPLTPPTDPPTLPIYIDTGGAADWQPPLPEEKGGGTMH